MRNAVFGVIGMYFFHLKVCCVEICNFQDFSGTTRLAESRVADMIDTYGFMTTCLGGFIVHLISSNELLTLWNRVLKIQPKTRGTSTHALIDIFGGFVYEITFTVISIWIQPMEYLSFFYYFLETFTYVALEITSFVIFMQFNHLVLACWRSFNALNFKLRKLLARVHFQPRKAKARLVFGFLLRLFYQIEFPHSSRLILKKLALEHAEIVSVCRMINQVFAVQNLLSVALIFIELTYAFYMLVVNFFQ